MGKPITYVVNRGPWSEETDKFIGTLNRLKLVTAVFSDDYIILGRHGTNKRTLQKELKELNK